MNLIISSLLVTSPVLVVIVPYFFIQFPMLVWDMPYSLDIFNESKCRYGSPKITKVLNNQGIKVSQKRVARRMKFLGLRSIIVKKFNHAGKSIPWLFNTLVILGEPYLHLDSLNILIISTSNSLLDSL